MNKIAKESTWDEWMLKKSTNISSVVKGFSEEISSHLKLWQSTVVRLWPNVAKYYMEYWTSDLIYIVMYNYIQWLVNKKFWSRVKFDIPLSIWWVQYDSVFVNVLWLDFMNVWICTKIVSSSREVVKCDEKVVSMAEFVRWIMLSEHFKYCKDDDYETLWKIISELSSWIEELSWISLYTNSHRTHCALNPVNIKLNVINWEVELTVTDLSIDVKDFAIQSWKMLRTILDDDEMKELIYYILGIYKDNYESSCLVAKWVLEYISEVFWNDYIISRLKSKELIINKLMWSAYINILWEKDIFELIYNWEIDLMEELIEYILKHYSRNFKSALIHWWYIDNKN